MTKPENIIKIIWAIVAGLVLIIGLAAFALSYNALADVAGSNGLDGWMSYVWPILLDVALVVFGLALVVMYLLRENVRWYWFLTGLFTVATIGFNLAHSVEAVSIPLWFVSVPLRPVIHIVAPVALFLSFHSLMEMMKLALNRYALVDTVSDLEAKKAALDAEIEDYRAEIETERQTLDAALDDQKTEMAGQIEALKAEIDSHQFELDSIRADIASQHQTIQEAVGDIMMIYEMDNDGTIQDIDLRQASPELRQQLLVKMALAGRDRDTIRDIYPVVFVKSFKTFDRDVSHSNGQLSRVWGDSE